MQGPRELTLFSLLTVANALELDRTLFSRVDANYQRDVQHLSRVDSYEGLSQEELLAFHSDYGPTAFTRPIRSCERFQLGYSSVVKLGDHKKARHGKALKCFKDGCAYNDVGYASPRTLREHQRKRHSKNEPRQVPKAIKRLVRNDQRNFSSPVPEGDQPQGSPNPAIMGSRVDPEQNGSLMDKFRSMVCCPFPHEHLNLSANYTFAGLWSHGIG